MRNTLGEFLYLELLANGTKYFSWLIKLFVFELSLKKSLNFGFSEILRANFKSKDVDTSDYWISDDDFVWLESEFGPFDADYFASD